MTAIDIIASWPSIEQFAADAGVSVGLARVWRTRKSIPADRWPLIEKGARERGIPNITAMGLAMLRHAAKDAHEAA